MCDDITEIENEEYLKRKNVSRRTFGTMAGVAGAGLAGLSPIFAGCATSAGATGITEQEVNITTPDGVADCHFAAPASGAHAAVIVWPDIMGLRPAFKTMGKRMAMDGYAVLTVNPFYRTEQHPVLKDGEDFAQPDVRNRLRGLAGTLKPDVIQRDTDAFLGWLDTQSAVDTGRKVGTTGYCMGGSITMRAAAHRPDRIGAGGSFHGGRLATDAQDSPHLLIPKMKAGFLIAIAANDDEREPEVKGILRESFDAAGVAAEIEVYEGAQHGWCPPDSRVYDEAAAEKAWARLMVLFKENLA